MIEVAGFEPAPPAPQVCENTYQYVIGGEHYFLSCALRIRRCRGTGSRNPIHPCTILNPDALCADVWERGTRAHEVVRHETRTLRQDRREEPSPLG